VVNQFIPNEGSWIHSHYVAIPEMISYFCGDLRGSHVLDVGCGDMMSSFGLLPLGVGRVTGLDLAGSREKEFDLAQVRDRLRRNNIAVSASYAEVLRYVEYDGLHFPFEDASFDVIVSWSAFEHIANVPQVLREIKRVCRRGGPVFIQVCPWYHCLQGSHLTDYISEPYFHLKRSPDWVRQKLAEYVNRHPDQHQFVLGHMWREYQSLNQYSAKRFYAEVVEQGFVVEKTITCTYEQDLSHAPPHISLDELMIYETKMLLRHTDTLGVSAASFDHTLELIASLHDREIEIADLRNSWSWRITEPLRKIGKLFENRR
jgi:ubiquinone/menaquinone biosynthesis C-methylase UbiE